MRMRVVKQVELLEVLDVCGEIEYMLRARPPGLESVHGPVCSFDSIRYLSELERDTCSADAFECERHLNSSDLSSQPGPSLIVVVLDAMGGKMAATSLQMFGPPWDLSRPS